VEDKGDKDDPHRATRNQAGYPVPGHQRWEPGKWHLELRENEELRPGRNSPSFEAATGRRTNRGSVSPEYGFSALALVKCSNEGGPGPRHNMKEDPGTFTLIMRREHGCHLYLMPWFSEAGDNRNRRMGLPPPTRAARTEPPPTPFQVHTPPPSLSTSGGQPRRKHTSASGTRSEAMEWARGGWGDHCELFSSSLGGQTAELVTSAGWPASYPIALPTSWMWNPWQASTTRQVNGRPVQDRSLYKESPCTFLPLSYNTRRSLHLQTPRIEIPTRSEEEQTVVKTLQAK